MDLAKHDRQDAARTYSQPEASERDRGLIANVLRAIPVECIEQHLALGGNCPYWPDQRREREAWVREIARQRGEAV